MTINKLKLDKAAPERFYIEEEHKMLPGTPFNKNTLYEHALKMELENAYGFESDDPEEQLKKIKSEIKARVKITAHEIFKIGELLQLAKRACRIGKIHFKVWIQENFDFSYETANNFMNVHKQCLGMRSIAVKLPISILYKISSPSFPEELRDYLFTQGNIEDMTNMDLENLTKRYEEGGFTAIENDIKKWNREYYIFRQIQFALDIVQDARKLLVKYDDQIRRKFIWYKIGIPSDEKPKVIPEVDEINKKLSSALCNAIVELDNAIEETRHLPYCYKGDVEEDTIFKMENFHF